MKKRFLSLLIASAAVLAAIPAFSGCSSETCVKYTLYDAEGNSVVTYKLPEDPSTEETSQAVEAEDGSYFVVTGYSGKITDLVIPAEYSGVPVTEIAAQAFEGVNNLKTVEIEDGVTTIGTMAFAYCSRLTQVTLPETLTTVPRSAFAYCSLLTSITIPDSVTAIGVYAFFNCSSLEQVVLSSNLTIISSYAFYYCESLKSVTFPEGLQTIGAGAFFYCTSIESVSLPDSVTFVGYASFQSCTSLASVTLGSGVTTIESFAFCNCPLIQTVTIPSDITFIGANAFYYCTALTDIYMDNEFSDGTQKACWLYTVNLSDTEDTDGVAEGTYTAGSDAAKTYLYTDYNYYDDDTAGLYGGYIPSGTFEDSAYMLQLLTEDLVGMEDVDGTDVYVYWYFVSV